MKKRNILFMITLIFSLFLGEAFCVENDQISFYWSLVVKDPVNHTLDEVDITGDINIPANRFFKFFFMPVKEAYIYLYHYNRNEGVISLYFPESVKDFDRDYAAETKYFLPGASGWFKKDNKKETEYFYLLVSKKRLTTLENLTESYDSFLKSRGQNAKTEELKAKILEEIRYLNQTYSDFTRNMAPPIPFEGNIRGSNEDSPEFFAKSIETKEFYGKTIRFINTQ